jgi:hypothetical protein
MSNVRLLSHEYNQREQGLPVFRSWLHYIRTTTGSLYLYYEM